MKQNELLKNTRIDKRPEEIIEEHDYTEMTGQLSRTNFVFRIS